MTPGELFYFGMLAGSVTSALIAKARGYSALLYGGAGLLLNFGSIPVALLLTSLPPALDHEQELGLTSLRRVFPASPQLCAWMTYYQGFRQAILLASLAAVSLAVISLLAFVTQIMPQFVMLYEGMSLALPVPTQIAVAICRFFRSDIFQWTIWGMNLIGPWICCRFLLTSYRFPLFGKVWRHADQIWLHLADGLPQAFVPDEVRRRLPEGSEPEGEIGCQRDYLQGALWTASLASLPLLACVTFLLTLLLLGIFLPLCGGGCVGNIGA